MPISVSGYQKTRVSMTGQTDITAIQTDITAIASSGRDSMREKRSTEMTMVGMTAMILPRLPGTVRRGKKAATVVRTAKITGRATWREPSIEAARRFWPSCSAR